MIKFFDIEVESWIKVECMLFLADMMIVIASCIILRSALAVYFDMISEHIRAIVASSFVICNNYTDIIWLPLKEISTTYNFLAACKECPYNIMEAYAGGP